MKSKRSNRVWITPIGLACALGMAIPAEAGVSLEARYLTGQTAPGTGKQFTLFGVPSINANGDIAFYARNGTITSDNAIWTDAGGALVEIARSGHAAPGAPLGASYSISGAETPVLNDAGQVMLDTRLSLNPGLGIDSSNDRGLWLGTPGAMQLVAREGDAAQGAGVGVVYSEFTHTTLNASGTVAFHAGLLGTGVGSTNNSGIWRIQNGTTQLIVREGDGSPIGSSFKTFQKSRLTDNGELAFGASLTVGGNSTNSGIWSSTGSGVNAEVIENQAAPGTGTNFSDFDFDPSFNGLQQLAFVGQLDPSVPADRKYGVWSESGGTLHLVAREGDSAPGITPGREFESFDFPLINNAGDTTFWARTRNSTTGTLSTRGLWLERGGALQPIAFTGQAAPGTAPGTIYSGDLLPAAYSLNNAGQVAFLATVGGGDSGKGLWATSPDGTLELVALEGMQVDVNPDPLIDELRTISSIPNSSLHDDSNGEDGLATSFNDAGQLAFKVNFTDGSNGILVASVVDDLPADLDGDGDVDGVDISGFFSAFTGPGGGPPANPAADLDSDGDVDGVDISGAFTAFTGPLAPVNVPEPSSIALLCIGGFALVRRR